MFRFFAYGIETPDRGTVNNIFRNRVECEQFCNQNGISTEHIVQLYNYVTMPYVEPKETSKE